MVHAMKNNPINGEEAITLRDIILIIIFFAYLMYFLYFIKYKLSSVRYLLTEMPVLLSHCPEERTELHGYSDRDPFIIFYSIKSR